MKTKKKKTLAAIYFAFAFCVSIQAQKFDNALSYMQYIGKESKSISTDMWDYTSSVAHGKSARSIEKRRNEVIETIEKARKRISAMPDFKGDVSYRDSTVAYLTISYKVMSGDYANIVNMEEISEQSYDAMEAYLMAKEKANEVLDIAGDIAENAQKEFAKKNDINLIESQDELYRKLARADKVFGYYNTVYLIFFKSYKQETYMLEALKNNDINALEQNKNSLISYSTEGLKKLDTLRNFKGDNSVKIACKQLLDFYKMESTTKISILSDFTLKKENFEKIKASIDAKSQANRTKEDVDQFNKAVNEFNKNVNESNSVNQELFQKRSKLLDNWNGSVKNFLDRNVPKK